MAKAGMEGALVITGPTASGKSGLALLVARKLEVEIISADSAQVYRGMDIGTAKPGPDVLAEVPHHLVDIREPEEPYSAALFREDVETLVPEILGRGRIPLIVGGTMLYLKALKEGLADLPEADESVRASINAEAEESGWEALHRQLAETDPESAARIKPSDIQRLQRAIEVYRLTGSTLTELHRQTTKPCSFPLREFAVVPPDRAELHQRIADRFHQMLAEGFIEEVSRLHDNPALNSSLPAIRAVGYRQAWSYLDGEIDRQTMIDMAIAATRQLAKRQYTWLRSWKDLICLDSPDVAQVLKILTSNTILD
jgi:tRNA dimethylallyltransferase